MGEGFNERAESVHGVQDNDSGKLEGHEVWKNMLCDLLQPGEG